MQKDNGSGLKLITHSSPFFEVYFNWNQLPKIDIQKEYFLLEILPDSEFLPPEYIRPNSAGPLFCCLNEGVRYTFNLLQLPYLSYRVESPLTTLPQVDLIQEHSNFHNLVWGKIDWELLQQQSRFEWLEIRVNQEQYRQHYTASPEFHFRGHPTTIDLLTEHGKQLFRLVTNLGQRKVVSTLQLNLPAPKSQLWLSRCVRADSLWRVKAEIPPRFGVEKTWLQWASSEFPHSTASDLIAEFQLFEDGIKTQTTRQWGYCCRINSEIIQHIQSAEWRLKTPQKVESYKLELQITSAHRELYKFGLWSKEILSQKTDHILSLNQDELYTARRKLFQTNHTVSWEQAHLELVLWFKTKDSSWHEFQRETAHLLQRDFIPQETTTSCELKLAVYEFKKPELQKIFQSTKAVVKDSWSPKIVLKPFNARQLLVIWQLDRIEVQNFIRNSLDTSLEQGDFFLKVHEEYLGKRSPRPDLEQQIIDLFSDHQNCYLTVEPDKTYSAEIVVRAKDQELALTKVSKPIVVPRLSRQLNSGYPSHTLSLGWFHPTQKEVRHQQGTDTNNLAKIQLHLHLHSPELTRLTPFREGFLRDVTWPIETDEGYQVHNPPGEWALRNCLDSWLPLLKMFRELVQEGIDFQVSLDISPTVAYALTSNRFKDYFSRYLLRTQAKAESQIAVMKARLDSPAFIWAAEEYCQRVKNLSNFYHFELNKDMIAAYRKLEIEGYLELSTCTATHGMAANQESLPTALKTQLALAARSHHRIFGERPKGIWLAENSIFPGVEKYLTEEALHYFFVEAEAVILGSYSPPEEEFNPIILPESEITAFARSRLGRVQVWDADIGYAGHPEFKEYHHRHYGLPIKKITTKESDSKMAYEPDKAEQVAREQAYDFYQKLTVKASELARKNMLSRPLITCSYDAELFGHHWWEGPVFLGELLREFYRKSDRIGLTTPSHYLADKPTLPVIMPNPSTWGHEASHTKWNDPKVAWVQRELEREEELLQRYLHKAKSGKFNQTQIEMVIQMGAELLRAQSSDLTFVIMAGDFEEDMIREIQKFLNYFFRLKYLIDNRIEDLEFLHFRQLENGMFPEIPDYYQIG